jgi:hypothetical protein
LYFTKDLDFHQNLNVSQTYLGGLVRGVEEVCVEGGAQNRQEG